jgi:hypothetical protein
MLPTVMVVDTTTFEDSVATEVVVEVTVVLAA